MSSTGARSEVLARRFRALVGADPEGIWAAPGRVNLIGEHTDYNDGFVLPAAIDREVLAAVRRRTDDVVTCRSLDLPGTAQVWMDELPDGTGGGWAAYVLGVVWALREAGVDVPGLDVVVASDVPVGGGLSSSAALEASAGLAACDLAGVELSRTELAVACRRAETEVVGAPVGIMDQTASLRGRAGHALLLDCRSLEVRHVPLALDELGLALLVLDTRVDHAHASGGYGERRRACERAAEALGVPALRDARLEDVERLDDEVLRRAARHVVTEDARVLETVAALEARDVDALGRLFAASHASMRDDFRISSPELDVAVAAAGQAGAAAARMTGGGFGGCATALVPREAREQVAAAVTRAFAEHGYRAPHVFEVQAAGGAARLS